MKCPGYYADQARAFELAGWFDRAAIAWRSARAASVGHTRRARYEIAMERCERKAKEARS